MKQLVTLVAFAAAMSSFAESNTGEAILTKYTVSDAPTSRLHDSRSVEIFANGAVRILTTKNGKETLRMKGPLKAETVVSIKACSEKLEYTRSLPRPTCASRAQNNYYVGDRLVSVRACGEYYVSAVPCVMGMKKILDRQ